MCFAETGSLAGKVSSRPSSNLSLSDVGFFAEVLSGWGFFGDGVDGVSACASGIACLLDRERAAGIVGSSISPFTSD
jgi:hypothetical protein